MGDFGLLLQDKLSEQQFAGLIDYMNNSKIKITGQNKVWLCCNVMVRALLIDDEALFEEAIREMKSVIKIENDEGVQFDWSFHQHGRQQQFGNYGLSYLSSLTQIGGLFLGTRYTFLMNRSCLSCATMPSKGCRGLYGGVKWRPVPAVASSSSGMP